MTRFQRGDEVLVDLGTAAKVRPCVVVSIPRADSQRNMSVVVPMTTLIRGGECEVAFDKPGWLTQESVINVLGIAGVDNSQVLRWLAPFPKADFDQVMEAISRLLGSTAGGRRGPRRRRAAGR